MKTILTSKHPLWEEFYDRLEGAEGCNFREDENGEITWNCKGGYDKTFAIRILQTYCDIDVERTLKYFEEHGGHCDCEILFNVK